MTTFEMRFIALRCKDTIAPTGTLAQGAGAKQINSLGEVYETKYGLTTSERVYGTVNEILRAEVLAIFVQRVYPKRQARI